MLCALCAPLAAVCYVCMCTQAAKTAGGPTRVEKAKIGLIQFHLSPPKADIENTVVISDYAQVCAAVALPPTPSTKTLRHCHTLLWVQQFASFFVAGGGEESDACVLGV